MAELGNCEQCGNVFVKNIRDVCPDCHRIEEEAFKKVYQFVSRRKNREAKMEEIVEATEVEEDLIIKFIKEKRLQVAQFPNLKYPCEKCGAGIAKGKICVACATEIKQGVHFHDEQIKRAEHRKKQDEQSSIYFTMNKDKK